MTVRNFNEIDFQAVCHIYIDAKRDELQFESSNFAITPLEQDAIILAAFKESDVLVFEDDVVLGFAAFCDNQVRALFVRGDARGKGIGRALLSAVLAANTGELSLNVAKSNLAARKFYDGNGFSVIGEAIRSYGGIDVTYVKMKSGSHHVDMRR
jgi:putative acetyltransferase